MVGLAKAAIRRVGYTGNVQPISGVDYVSFQAAHDASASGDTIQLYPSTSTLPQYTGTINKPLVIIGPGYYTNTSNYVNVQNIPNYNLQNMAGSISGCNFTIDFGSTGTIIEGLYNVTVATVNGLNVLNNITISRCAGLVVNFNNSANCDGWKILQCYGVNINQSGFSASFTGDRTITNLAIQNSVFVNAGFGTISGISLNTSPSGVYSGNKIYNCIFTTNTALSFNGATFSIQNCIFENPNITAGSNVSFIKNISSGASGIAGISNSGSNSGNQFSINISGLFVGYPTNPLVLGLYTYSPDGQFQLATSSTAKNAGFLPGTSTVTDCGVFGGNNPYVLSGIPPIPVFIKLNSVSAIPIGSTYTMSFSIISNN